MWEWNKPIIFGASRVFRGGSFAGDDVVAFLRSTIRNEDVPASECFTLGFRVSQALDARPVDRNHNGFLDFLDDSDLVVAFVIGCQADPRASVWTTGGGPLAAPDDAPRPSRALAGCSCRGAGPAPNTGRRAIGVIRSP